MFSLAEAVSAVYIESRVVVEIYCCKGYIHLRRNLLVILLTTFNSIYSICIFIPLTINLRRGGGGGGLLERGLLIATWKFNCYFLGAMKLNE